MIREYQTGDRVTPTLQGYYAGVAGTIADIATMQYGHFKRYIIELDNGKTVSLESIHIKPYTPPQIDAREYHAGERVAITKRGLQGVVVKKNHIQVTGTYTKYVVVLENGKQIVASSDRLTPLEEV